jgi:hypothetical protein
MQNCDFILNNKPMSTFSIAGQRFNAFSGKGAYINNARFSHVQSLGSIPTGDYLIVDKPQGGGIGTSVQNLVKSIWSGNDRDKWFALFRLDGTVDDETFINNVRRGEFRLHPGTVSLGCVTIPSFVDFDKIRSLLLGSGKKAIAKAGGKVGYGILTVHPWNWFNSEE